MISDMGRRWRYKESDPVTIVIAVVLAVAVLKFIIEYLLGGLR